MSFKTNLKIIVLIIIYFTSAQRASAQTNRTTFSRAVITGSIADSFKKNKLNNIKVSIANATTGIILVTKQTNKEGLFNLPMLPTATALQLQITEIGYRPYKKKIILAADKSAYNLGIVFLQLDTIDVTGLKSSGNLGARNEALSIGNVIGKVRDSVYRNVLSSATVSIYNFADSNLLKFTIPNSLGEFDVQKLPLKTRLKLLITHVGYTPYEKTLSLDTNRTTIDLDWIDMNQNAGKETQLQEVNITSYAPVRMNGDTLEFNPRAFNMDANATTEDLMRRLPGMVIWGDGDITFNGKKINSLLVNGKPFMGNSDMTTASQNLPKDVVDKIQIYSQRNEKNPLDSTLNANLKLKEDKKMGYFGKVGIGYGSRDRFATEGMLSGYDNRLQITTVGALNNTNKSAADINTLIHNSSYKGEGNRTDYQSDFRRAGINIGTTLGTRFQYDFIPGSDLKKSRRLQGDYLYMRDNETISDTRQTKTMLQKDSILTGNAVNHNKNVKVNSNLSADYVQKDENYSLTVSTDANIRRYDNTSNSSGQQTRNGKSVEELSNSSILKNDHNLHKEMAVDAVFDYQKEITEDSPSDIKTKQLLAHFTIAYKFNYDEDKGDIKNLSSIVSVLNPEANESFDRWYRSNNTGNGHTLNLIYPKLKKLLFGSANLAGIDLELSTNGTYFQRSTNSTVYDKNIHTLFYEKNDYLTTSRSENIKNIQPKLSISKTFYKGLTNRYSQRLDVLAASTLEYYSLRSVATQKLQNFSYQYSRFLPSASLVYSNHQYGDFELNSSLNYRSQVKYPTVEHIAPLVDSANFWFITKANPHMQPEYINTFAGKISLESRKAKNPYKINLEVDGNFSNNKISDSSSYDNLGRRINYNINLAGNKYWHLGGSYRKAYSPNKNNTFQAIIWYNHFYYRIPQYLDAHLLTTENRNNDFDFDIAYSFLDIVAVNAKQGFSFYKNLQNRSSQIYSGSNNYTRLTGNLQLPKNLTWSTNIDFNANKAKNQSTIRYTIWNASLTYRFMQGNQAEVRFSAMDLLKQNKSVINNTNRNVQTFGYNNVLQQYFMLSLAYYPRKFGKN